MDLLVNATARITDLVTFALLAFSMNSQSV